MADHIQLKNGSTNVYPVEHAERITLTPNVYLTRLGNLRILNIDNYTLGSTHTLQLSDGDKPKNDEFGFGLRTNGNLFLCAGYIEVYANGTVAFYYIGDYNSAGSGAYGGNTGDTFKGCVIWEV